ncbi:MAG: hypothetical protein COV44_05520 [Deltaproteobacteria bacterium CG11_big_fil_rev_8_21_14_0_20_45_16]|nr:MAG: hypothetical protein COV44_05520 [Deltaproteobacteria bacterium CG11_big_fil_rev_8_21_14_0_20_45_16]
MALRILENFKPAMTAGDLPKALEFQKAFEGTALYAWAKEALPQAFLRMNPAETALGRKLEAALSSKDREARTFVLAALHGSSEKTSLMFQAFQGISKRMKEEGLSYERAVENWLLSPEAGIQTKARYLGMFLNSPRFHEYLSKLPEREREEVMEAINEFSSYFLFEKIARGESPRSQPGILGRLLGRGESASPRSNSSNLPSNLIVESFEFVDAPIPEGGVSFTMGSPPTEADRGAYEPLTEVTLTKAFQMQVTPVPQWQYEAVMGKNPSHFGRGENAINRPVEKVSWHEAVAFAQKLSELDPNWNYRLPTEAEWELMVRAGTKTAYSFGNDVSELKDYGLFSENAERQTHPVTSKRPNPWGIYDMHGNVWEWQSDWWAEAPQGSIDPQGPESGSYRVLRGGSWDLIAQDLRSARRYYVLPGFRYINHGLRLVRTPK